MLYVSCMTLQAQKKVNLQNPWASFPQILKNIKAPVFPDRIFNVKDFGAIADGVTDNTLFFKNAISACSKSGGGMVLVPKGIYFSKAIHLQDNVNFHLEDGVEILFSTHAMDYYPLVHTSFEGTELMNYSPMIYAYGKKNIAITGNGILNGQSDNSHWWNWVGSTTYGWVKGMPSQADPANRPRLVDMAEAGIPVGQRIFGEGHYLRPNFIEFFGCTNALIQGVKITNTPFWNIHPIKTNNLTIEGVTIESHGPNNDGCNPEYSKNVRIKKCIFNTGDDCIAIKAGRDADGRRVGIKTENIIVQDCTMFDGHGGVTIGSEISAGVGNVFVENCVMSSPNLDIAIRLKTNSRRGGLIGNFFVRNVEIGQVKEAVLKVDMFYNVHGNQQGAFIPRVENIYLENVRVKNGGEFGILAKGYKQSPVKNIQFNNVVIDKVETKYSIDNVEHLKFTNTKINGELVVSPPK